jgi:acid phosphatase family membrane protein YuiD
LKFGFYLVLEAWFLIGHWTLGFYLSFVIGHLTFIGDLKFILKYLIIIYKKMYYSLIFIPIIAAVLAQIIKVIVALAKRKFSWRELNRYGGNPSSHTAIVVALVTELLIMEGISSSTLAVAVVVAILTIRDAVGLRQHLGNHGKVLNQLIKELPDKEEYKFPYLEERLGHTPWEAICGALLGIAVSLIFHLIAP